jgi:hypothetical protein
VLPIATLTRLSTCAYLIDLQLFYCFVVVVEYKKNKNNPKKDLLIKRRKRYLCYDMDLRQLFKLNSNLQIAWQTRYIDRFFRYTKQTTVAGGQTLGGRKAGWGLATRRAYRYDPITTRDTFLIFSD